MRCKNVRNNDIKEYQRYNTTPERSTQSVRSRGIPLLLAFRSATVKLLTKPPIY